MAGVRVIALREGEGDVRPGTQKFNTPFRPRSSPGAPGGDSRGVPERKAEVGFEPTNDGFAIRSLSPLGYSAGWPVTAEARRRANQDTPGKTHGQRVHPELERIRVRLAVLSR